MHIVLRVFQIAVRRIRAERLSSLALCLEYGTDFLARILGVELVHDVEERGEIALGLACAVHAVVDGNEPHIRLRECYLGVVSHLQIVPSETAQVLYDKRPDPAFIDHADEPLPIRSCEGGPTVAIVHEELGVAESVIIRIFL